MQTRTSKRGFTLAEVLVTLVVIGIVAALSIPALLQNTNQAELRTAFKKSLSTLNQALVMSVAQNATDAGTCCAASDKSALATFFADKLNVIQSNTTATDPFFYTADGMQYTVTKKDAICGPTDSADPASAHCIITVDVNGMKSPNSPSSGNSTSTPVYKDQYQVVVRSNSVIPASSNITDVAVQALQN